MKFVDFIQKHITYLSANDVAEICKPLFKACNLNYFDYQRIYPDGSNLLLISHQEGFLNCCSKDLPAGTTIVSSGIHLWQDYLPEEAIYEDAHYFDICNGITICNQNQDFIECFEVGAPASNHSVIDFYFNHLDLLNQFLLYFKDKAAKLIDQAYKERFILPEKMRGIQLVDKSYDDFCKLINNSKIHINFCNREAIFTRREYDCLTYIAKGRTMKETARILAISPRTVEEHLNNAKNKTNCTTKSQLLDIIGDSDRVKT